LSNQENNATQGLCARYSRLLAVLTCVETCMRMRNELLKVIARAVEPAILHCCESNALPAGYKKQWNY